MDVTCKNQLSDDELFLYVCCDSIDSIPESDPATVNDLYLDGGLVSRLASSFFISMLTSPHLVLCPDPLPRARKKKSRKKIERRGVSGEVHTE